MKNRLILAGFHALYFPLILTTVALIVVFFWTIPIIWIFTGIWWHSELLQYVSCQIDYKINEYDERVLRK